MFAQTGEYALRAASYIAVHGRQRPVGAHEIAAETGIPHKYLQKVLTDLVRSGVLRSTRGIGGGFRITDEARRMTIAEILKPFGDIAGYMRCPFGNLHCGQGDPCPVHDKWARIAEAYAAFVDSTTLGDLMDSPNGEELPRSSETGYQLSVISHQ